MYTSLIAQYSCNYGVFCLSVFYQNSWTTINIETVIELPTNLKLYEGQNKIGSF